MAEQVTKYRGAVRKNLRCGAATKNRLMAKLDRLLDAYAEEHGEASAEALISAFGAPEEMAKTLATDATPDELERYCSCNRAKKYILCVLLAVFIVFSIWLYFFKEVGLTSTGTGGVVNEFTVPTSHSKTGDDVP